MYTCAGARTRSDAAERALINATRLLRALTRRRTDVVLVQNPPSIPTLAVALLSARITGARVVIDWHNLGFNMLEHGGRAPAWMVGAARVYERVCARMANKHLSVTNALATWLRDHFGVRAAVVHDRPHGSFARMDRASKLQARARLPLDAPWLADASTALVVSATSWTADEDFDVLLDAMAEYARVGQGPRVVLVVTGKGPLRARFEASARSRAAAWETRVCVRTAWLSHDDYALLLGAADVGVSMHTSTSGLDLPMKVLDFFGAGLPVLAVRFACLDELVTPANGRTFSTANECAMELAAMLRGYPEGAVVLDELRAGIGGKGWDANWDEHAWPVLRKEAQRAIKRRREQPWWWRGFALGALVVAVALALLLALGVARWAASWVTRAS